jgi:hypothetical protein
VSSNVLDKASLLIASCSLLLSETTFPNPLIGSLAALLAAATKSPPGSDARLAPNSANFKNN